MDLNTRKKGNGMLGLSEQDYEKDSKIYKNIITNLKIKASKIHKKTFTNLEINVPVAIKENFYPHVVSGLGEELFLFCKYNNIDKIRRDLQDLFENFEREICDLIQKEDPHCVYLVVFRLLNPELKPSNKYRFIGFVEVFDDIIQVIWLHPFFRNKRIITNFLVWYGTNENIFLLQHPVLPSCEKAVKNAEKIIKENFEYNSKHLKLYRDYLKKKNPEAKIDELLDSDLYQVVQGMSLASNFKKDMSASTAIQLTTDALIHLRRNPESLESIKNELRIELGVPDDMDL